MFVTIGQPVSPATMLTVEAKKAKAILLSYGGGMGGAQETIYCSSINRRGRLYEVIDIYGETKEINPAFIVKIEDVQILRRVTDITAWAKYDKDRNQHVTKAIRTDYLVIGAKDTWRVMESIVHDNAHIILTIDDITPEGVKLQ